MPPKTCKCALCGQTVTKRSTLSLEELGGGDGRACREHEEVINLVTMHEQKQADDKLLRAAMNTLRAMSLAAIVRGMYTFEGVPPEFIYQRVKASGLPQEVIDKARKMVADQGGPLMTEKDIETLAITTVLFSQDRLNRQGAAGVQI